MTPRPLISFIIPSYNHGRFLERTLDSIAAQGLPEYEFEILVFDGGSTDDTCEILRTHALKPTWVSRKDKGQSDAINQGFTAAHGEIIAWINSDDIYLPGALEKVIHAFQTEPKVRVIYGRALLIDEADNPLGEYPVEHWNYDKLANTCFLCQPAVFFRRDIIKQYGLLDDSLHYAMDYEYWLRIGRDNPFRLIDTPLAASRIYAQTKTLRDKPGVFREGLEVSHRHTGKWSRPWLRGYGYWLAVDWQKRHARTFPWITPLIVIIIRARLYLKCFASPYNPK